MDDGFMVGHELGFRWQDLDNKHQRRHSNEQQIKNKEEGVSDKGVLKEWSFGKSNLRRA